jgi:hypothetical protein
MHNKSMFSNRNFVWSIIPVIFLAATIGCSSMGSSVSSTPASATVPAPVSAPAPTPEFLTGVFIDGPVSGITYQTPTLGGMTDKAGAFKYKPGEKVTFSIGSVVLGSAVGKPILTPLDIVEGAKDTSDQRVINICVFLQTLDQDGNPENGITISRKAASFVYLYGSETNFNQPARAFSFDPGFRNVLNELNEIDAFGETPRAVTSPTVAQKNLNDEISKLKK